MKITELLQTINAGGTVVLGADKEIATRKTMRHEPIRWNRAGLIKKTMRLVVRGYLTFCVFPFLSPGFS